MVEIARLDTAIIELRGVKINDGDKVAKIMDICHKYKHLYLDGYPCGRKTRKAKAERTKRWDECPGICISYFVTNDNRNHRLAIHALVSDVPELLKKFTQDEIDHFTQQYTQDVADEIIKTLNPNVPEPD